MVKKLLGLFVISLPIFASPLPKPQPAIFLPKKTVGIMEQKAQTQVVEKKITYILSAMKMYQLLSGEKFITQDGGKVKVDKVCMYIKNPQTGEEKLVGCKILQIQPLN